MSENVVHLHKPTDPPADDAAPTVLTVVPDAPPTRPVPLWVRSGRAVKSAVTHERTRSTGRAVARHGSYTFNGGRIVARRTWDGRTGARYERMIRAAEAAGNLEAAEEWEERLQRFRAARHHRRMDLLHSPVEAAKGIAVGAGMSIGVLVALGVVMAINTGHVGDVITPLTATIDFIALLIRIVQIVWGPALTIGPFLALLALWSVGRKQQAAPNWALPANVRNGEGEPITPSIVVKALRDLGVPALRNAIKEMGDSRREHARAHHHRRMRCRGRRDPSLRGVDQRGAEQAPQARREPHPARARGVHHHPPGGADSAAVDRRLRGAG